MAINSSLFTVDTKLDKLNISVPATVNTDDVDVNKDKAPASYNAIMTDYTNIKSQFQKLAGQLTKAKSRVKGSKLKGQVGKASSRVQNQGTYCGNRANDLKNAFEFAQIESRVKSLEDQLEKAVGKTNSEGN